MSNIKEISMADDQPKKPRTDDELNSIGTEGRKRGRKPKIRNVHIEHYSEEEYVYYHSLTENEKRKVADEEQKMHDLNNKQTPLRFRVLNADLDPKIKAIAVQKLNYLTELDRSSSEYYRTISWIESVCKIPFGKYKSLPVNFQSNKGKIKAFLGDIKSHMDKKVFGHTSAKDHIIRLLAQWVSNPTSKGMVIGIHGAMGCGKTMLVKEGICGALGLPFAFVPLGGANDGCYLEGHSYTYEGSTWGKIVDVLMKAGVMNPVIFFDELDKVSDSNKGEEIINLLVHLTDSTQNDRVTDKYFIDFEFDLSRSLIIFSYNHEERVNPILRDRMIKIKTDGYTTNDKITICNGYMVPELLKQYNLTGNDVHFNDEIIKEIIGTIDTEKGVRNLKRALEDIISNLNLNRLLYEQETSKTVTIDDVKKYIHNRKQESPALHMYL